MGNAEPLLQPGTSNEEQAQNPGHEEQTQNAPRKWLRYALCMLVLSLLAFVLATLPPFPSPAPKDAVVHIIVKDDARLVFNATAISAADTSYFHGIQMESAICRVMTHDDEEAQVVGTDWAECGVSRPAIGIEIENEALATALQNQVTFTWEEFEQLGLPDDLSPDAFVKARNLKYYRPVAKGEIMYISVSGPLSLVARVDTLVGTSALETVVHSVDGSLAISNFRAATRIALSKEDVTLNVRCKIKLQVSLYLGVIDFVHIQGLDQEFGSRDLQEAAVETVEHANFDSVKETMIDLPNSVSVEPKPIDYVHIDPEPVLDQGRGNSSDVAGSLAQGQGMNASDDWESARSDDSSAASNRRRVSAGEHDQYLGIHFQPLLPYIRDSSGVIKALYIHAESGVSANITAAFASHFNERVEMKVDNENALAEVTSFPFSWLLVTGNETRRRTLGDDRSRARLFGTCAGGCGAHTLRAAAVTAMNAWTTHPMRAVVLSAAASPSTSKFFRSLVGDDKAVLTVDLVPEKRRGGLAQDAPMCMQMDLLTFRVEGCFQVEQNDAGDDLIPTSLPSGSLTMADRTYFETGQGELLLYASANVTKLARSTPDRARTVVGSGAGYWAEREGPGMAVNASRAQDALVASGDLVLDVLDMRLNTNMIVDFGLVREDFPAEMDDKDTAFYLAAAQLLDKDEGQVLFEFSNFAVGQGEPVFRGESFSEMTWNVASTMKMVGEELFAVHGVLETQRHDNTTRGLIADGSLTSQGLTVAQGRATAHMIEREAGFEAVGIGSAGMGTQKIINGRGHAYMSWAEGLQMKLSVVDTDMDETLVDVMAATAGVVTDEESSRGQGVMEVYVKISDEDNLTMRGALSGNLPSDTGVATTSSNSGGGDAVNGTRHNASSSSWADILDSMLETSAPFSVAPVSTSHIVNGTGHNASNLSSILDSMLETSSPFWPTTVSTSNNFGMTGQSLHVTSMVELKLGDKTLLLADLGGAIRPREQSIGIHGVGKVVVDDQSIIDMKVLADAAWPQVVGGPEGRYEGGLSLIQADSEVVGLNASIEGQQMGAELTGQGGLEVRVVEETLIAGSGRLSADWSDGMAVAASMMDGDDYEVIGVSASGHGWDTAEETRGELMVKLTSGSETLLLGEGKAGVMLKEQTFGPHGMGKVVVDGQSIIDMKMLADAAWPQVVGGPEGRYEGGLSLIQADSEVVGLNASIEGQQMGAELTGQGGLEVRVVEETLIAGSGRLSADWSDGMAVAASMMDGDDYEVIGVSASGHGWEIGNETRGEVMMKLSAGNTTLLLGEGEGKVMLKEQAFGLQGLGKVEIGGLDLSASAGAAWPSAEATGGAQGDYQGSFSLVVDDREVFGLNTSMAGEHSETMLSTAGSVSVHLDDRDDVIDGTSHLNMSWAEGLQMKFSVVDTDMDETLVDVMAATAGVVTDEESSRGQGVMEVYVKISDEDNLTMRGALSGNLPSDTGVATTSSNSGDGDAVNGTGQVELKLGDKTLLLADLGGAIRPREQSIGIHGVGKVVVDDQSIIDMKVLADAAWPQVVGGPEGRYEGGLSLMQADSEVVGLNASIEGQQMGAELTGQGGLEVRVVEETLIAGSGKLSADWSDGMAVEASMMDGDDYEVIGVSASGNQWTTEGQLWQEGMVKLTAGSETLLIGEQELNLMLKEQTFGLQLMQNVAMNGQSILDQKVLAGAAWPQVVGGPEGRYEGGLSLMQADSEVVGLNASIEGQQMGAELTGQGGLEVRVVEETLIAGSGKLSADWSDGMAVEASMMDGDDYEVIGVSASGNQWTTEAMGGPDGGLSAKFSLTLDDNEILDAFSEVLGNQADVALVGGGAVGIGVDGVRVIDGSGHMQLNWSQGLQFGVSLSNGPSVLARVNGSAKVHGAPENSVVSFMESYMTDDGRMDFGMDLAILNARMMNVTGNLISSDMRAGARRSGSKEGGHVACLRLDAGGRLHGNEDDENAISKMRASSDLRFSDFSGSMWDATVEHAMIRMSMNSFEDTISETSDAFEAPPPCSTTSSGMLSFDMDTRPELDLELLEPQQPPPPTDRTWGLFSWDAEISTALPACSETRDWQEISHNDLWVPHEPKGQTGGLGKLMLVGKFEVWVCLEKPQCISEIKASSDYDYLVDRGITSPYQNFMCYVYDEEEERFIPWAAESVLMMFGFLEQR